MSDSALLKFNEGDRPTENPNARTPYAIHKVRSNTSENDANECPKDTNEAHSTLFKSKRIRLTSGSHLSQNHDDIEGTSDYHFAENEDARDPRDAISIQLSAQKMEPKMKTIILKYVGSEQIVRCLEFAGFISPHVLGHLDDDGVRRLENFVGHACSFLSSHTDRQMLLGPVFSRHPDQFRLPTGAVLGLLMAANEIRQLIFKSSATPDNAVEPVGNACSRRDSHSTKETASQTDVSSLTLGSSWLYNTIGRDIELTRLSSPAFVKEQPGNPASSSDHMNSLPSTPISTFASGLPSSISSSNTSDPMAVMNAAIQAAAVVAMAGSGSVNHGDYSGFLPRLDRALFSGGYSAISPSTQIRPSDASSSTVTNSHNSDDIGSSVKRDTVPATTSAAAGISFQLSGLHQPPGIVFPSNSSVGETSGSSTSQLSNMSSSDGASLSYTSDEISRACLERLKQHSSDRASRLAARQFVDAQLLRGRDFDMEMEVSLNAEGLKRVTGIFYCHLCRVTRERTCAVRFSIARNRYPVLSNVLSHLKTHFQYKTQPTFSEISPASQPVQHLCPATSSTSLNETSGLLGAEMAASLMASPVGGQNSVSSPSSAFFQQQSPTSSKPTIKCELADAYSLQHQALSDSNSHGFPGLGSHNNCLGGGNSSLVSPSRHLAHGNYHHHHHVHHGMTDRPASHESRGLLDHPAGDQHVQSMPTT